MPARRMLAAFAAAAAQAAAAQGAATADEATALVQRAVAYVKAHGRQQAYAEFSNRHGAFVDRDLYVTVHDLDGTVLAHGANAKMIGKNLIELKDVDGRPFVKERLALARSQPRFWQSYKFTNPVTHRIEPKRVYCERLDDSVICSGAYR